MAGNHLETSITIRAGVEGISDLNQLLNIIEQAGGDVTQLRQATTQLQNTWNTLTTEEQNRQLQEMADTANGVARSTNNATAQMERFLGVRSNNTINAEITQVNTALATLRQRLNAGTISQDEFNRMNAAGEQRLNALKAELNQTAADIQRVGNVSGQAGGGFTKLKTSLMGMAGAYVGVQTVTTGIKQLVNTAKDLDSLTQKLEYATGSAKAAGETWDYLKNLANELGLEQMGLAEGYAQLASATKNLNMSTDDTRTAFEGVANAAAAMSLTTDETNGVMLALSQIAGKGKVSMEELRGQLGERLTPAMGIAAKAMGVTTQELENMVEQGIDAKEFLPKFGEALTQAFAGQAANNINTTTGAINLLTNKLTDLKAKVLDGFAGDAISSGMQFFADTLDKISNAMDNIDPASIEAVKQVFAQLFSVIGTISQTLSGLYTDFNNLFAAMTGFDDTSEKVGFLTRTVQGLSVVIGAVDDVFKGLQATANLAIGGILDAFSRLYGVMAKFELLPDGLQEKYQNMSDGLKKASDDAFVRLDKNVNEFESSTKKALDATIVTAEQMAEQAEKASQKAIEAFDKLAKDSTASGEQLAKSFGEAVDKATSPEQIEELINTFGELQAQGKITGEELAQGINLATPKIVELENALKNTGDTAKLMADDAQDAAQDIKVKMADTAQALGVDFELASNQVSKALQKSVGDVQNLADNFDELKGQGYDASNLLVQGLQNMQEQAKNQADYHQLIQLWQQFGSEGKLSTEQVEAGIDGINKKLEKSPNLLDDTSKALQALGIISKAEAEKQAEEQIRQFELAKKAFDEGLVSAEQMQKAYDKVQQSVEVNGSASQQAWLNSQQYVIGLTQTVDEATSSIDDNTQATATNTTAKTDNAKASEDIAEAEAKAEQAQTSRLTSYTRYAPSFIASAEQQISKLQELGATQEQTTALTERFYDQLSRMPSPDIYKMADNVKRLSTELDNQVNNFNKAKQAADYWSSALGSAEVSSNDLALAQLALKTATRASIDGIIDMDSQTLSGLQSAIDGARQRMVGLADDAKATADRLEATLAKMQGNEDKARSIEQSKKLLGLEAKISEAKARGNTDEIKQLERALALQKQINAEEYKQARQRQADERRRQTERSSNSPAVTSSGTPTNQGNENEMVAKEVVDSLVEAAIKQGGQAMLKQLADEAKRMAR